jgi:hypothetical protein
MYLSHDSCFELPASCPLTQLTSKNIKNRKNMKVDIDKIIGTSDFRAQTARIFDDVENNHATYLITRGSKPIAVIGPVPTDIGSSHVATTLPTGNAETPEHHTAPAESADWHTLNPAVTNDPIDIE